MRLPRSLRSLAMTIMYKFKNFLKHFFLIDDSPHKVAAGAALGIFLGIVPGEGVVSTLVLASLLHFNRLSATAGVFSTNMWGTVLVMPLAAFFGGKIFGVNPASLVENFNSTFELGLKYFFSKVIFLDLLLPLIVGFVIVSGAIALLFYFLLYYLLKYHKLRFK
jgi:uncharacterized protein (DUF2062 family)